MAKILYGKPVAESLKLKYQKEFAVPPCLGILRVGNKADDFFYEKNAIKKAKEWGVRIESYVYPQDVNPNTVFDTLDAMAKDPAIQGILPLLPFDCPWYFEEEKKLKPLIPMHKDVDCVSPKSAAALYLGEKGFPPCTPQGVMELLQYYGIDVCGKNVIIIGRSMVVGKPLAMLMLAANATVTVCHSKTEDLKSMIQSRDIIIAALGKANFLTADYFREGQIVVDVGIHKTADSYCGDVDFAAVKEVVAAITPVPGGVGTITTSLLLSHVFQGLEDSHGQKV